MLSVGAESFVVQFAIQKCKDEDIQNYNFAFFLYGCETKSLTLSEEHRRRVLENRLLRRIFGPTRDKITWERRKLHNEELIDLYCSPNIIHVIKSRRMRWAWRVTRMGEGDVRTGLGSAYLREGDHLEDLSVDEG